MKCSNCGYESSEQFLVCPNCHMMSTNNTSEVVNTQVLESNQNNQVNGVISTNVSESINNIHGTMVEQKRDMSKIYYLILAVCVVIFLILMSIIIFKHYKNVDKPADSYVNNSSTTEPIQTILTKNKGIHSNLIAPVNIGDITFGGLLDSKTERITDADVLVTRHLSETEINSIVLSNPQSLNPGFKWDGVEYRVTLNDFDYLGDDTIIPKMKTYLFDTYYKNNFFLVNENYYTIEAIDNLDINPIRNGESAILQVAYQVPLNQDYYICFGENFSSLGCFKSN